MRSRLIEHGPLTIDLAAFRPQAEMDAYIVYVGRLLIDKGIGTLIRAMAKVPQARLLLIGEGEHRAQFEALAAREIDLVLVLSPWPETFSFVAHEAFAAGADVVTARDGEEGLGYLLTQRFDVLLTDLRMPVMDGWGFAQAVQARGLALPIVVMTAAQDARRWAHEIQAVGYLSKPFDIADLLAAVARFDPA